MLLTVSTFAADTLRIPVWVEGSGAAPAFTATLNGKSAPVTLARGPGSDQMILIVLDFTGDLSFIDPARQALEAAINRLPPNAWVGLLRDQDGLHVLADPAADHKPAVDAIQSLGVTGKPGLLDTVQSALSLGDAIARQSAARTAVLYITDSDITEYREDYTNPVINASDPHDLSRRFPEALIQEKISKLQLSLSTLQPPLFVVHLNPRTGRLNQAYQNGLKTLSDSMNGETILCRTVAEIPEAISQVFQRVTNSWVVTIALPAKPSSNVQVRLAAKSGSEDLKLIWRQRVTLKRK
jgi:hypothetical protein